MLVALIRYLRALAAFYVRLTFDPVNVYEVLEPLLDDYRKIRIRYMSACSLSDLNRLMNILTDKLDRPW